MDAVETLLLHRTSACRILKRPCGTQPMANDTIGQQEIPQQSLVIVLKRYFLQSFVLQFSSFYPYFQYSPEEKKSF